MYSVMSVSVWLSEFAFSASTNFSCINGTWSVVLLGQIHIHFECLTQILIVTSAEDDERQSLHVQRPIEVLSLLVCK